MDPKNFQEYPVDAVILWVDGNDEKHRKKMLPYLDNKAKMHSEKFRTRFDQVDEIRFSVDSLLKFAPYIRQIHIVTDEQTPSFLKDKNAAKKYAKVSVVDHKLIFKNLEQFLPTFNSITIESCIHRIPDLAEHFIYLNDDFFLINPTRPEDFFHNGLPVLRGKWLKINPESTLKKLKKSRFSHKRVQQNSARLAGFDSQYYNFKHTPLPLRKSTLADYFDRHQQIFSDNLQYRFRNKNQFLAQGLANHLEIKNKSCVLKDDFRLIYYRSYKKPLLWYKFKMNINTRKKLFLGMQSLDQCPENILNYLLQWLKNRIADA